MRTSRAEPDRIMEAQLALRSLLARFPQLRLAVPAGALRWDRGAGLVLRGLGELPVVPDPALGLSPLSSGGVPNVSSP